MNTHNLETILRRDVRLKTKYDRLIQKASPSNIANLKKADIFSKSVVLKIFFFTTASGNSDTQKPIAAYLLITIFRGPQQTLSVVLCKEDTMLGHELQMQLTSGQANSAVSLLYVLHSVLI